MSEKHLAEASWKVLVTKQGVKDIGLGKALTAYGNLDGTKEPAKALEALKEISELALKLKKANPAKEEVVTHLDEVVKEVKRTMPSLEARAKSAAQAPGAGVAKPAAASKPGEEDDAEEKEAAEFQKDLKKQLVSALAQVKVRAPGDPEQQKEPKPQLQFMAYFAGKGCAVIVARKVGSATKKLLPDIAGGATGGKFVLGECIFEKAAHTFVVEKVPGGLAKQLAKALTAETGAKYKVRVRNTDGSMELDSDTDVDLDAAGAPPPAPPGAAPERTPEGMTKFTARFQSLQPDLLKAIAAKTAKGDEARQRAAEAGAQAKNQDFAAAHKSLDAVEQLTKQVLTAPVAASATEPAAPPKQIKLSTYLSGRKNLRAAREGAENELKRLQQAVLAKAADEPFYKEVESKSQKLFEYLAPIDDSVANKLDDAGRCVDPEDQAVKNEEVRKLIRKQLTALRDHPLASFVEKNLFGKFAIKQPLEVTLSALDQQLS
jgi:hypothetical protein